MELSQRFRMTREIQSYLKTDWSVSLSIKTNNLLFPLSLYLIFKLIFKLGINQVIQRRVYMCWLENKFHTGTLLPTSFIQPVSQSMQRFVAFVCLSDFPT